ncbi:MAG: ATP-binding cassette domain-containing protein [Christensenellaceae bacterium]|jgi:ABC-2 type transport system ATP-binding protein|nr:ATP-binding cassette domain-containing protein [Christensenellaceae bacterium]
MGIECVLKITNLFKSYGRKDVLCGLNMNLNKGECIGIVGKNGPGKTTILEIIDGLLMNYGGQVDLHGNNVSALIDSPVFFSEFTERDNI